MNTFVMLAYAITVLGLGAYTLWLKRRLRSAEETLAELDAASKQG